MGRRIGYDLGLYWQAKKVDVCSKVGAKADRKVGIVYCNDSEACLGGKNRSGDDLVGREGKCCGMFLERQLASLRCSW